jgi:hypothetical protein
MEDVITDVKRVAVMSTLAHVSQFLENLLTVIPFPGPFPLMSPYDWLPVSANVTDGATDLHVTAVLRPLHDNEVMATSIITRESPIDNRPIQGFIVVNPATVPSVAQSYETSGDRSFFEAMLHELFHLLGLSKGSLPAWINASTGSVYNSTDLMYVHRVGKKTFTVLTTPKLHSVAVARWGTEYFFGDVSKRSGVELEDGGGEGTAGSHFEGRLYFEELMAGWTSGPASISEFCLSALEDTGWYGVNYSYSEALMFGDYRSIVGSKQDDFRHFPYGAPGTGWPHHYVPRTMQEADAMFCTYNHRAVGLRNNWLSRRFCNQTTEAECAYPEFYDATNMDYYGSHRVDYTFILLPDPNGICQQAGDQSMDHRRGGYHGRDAMCAATTMIQDEYGDSNGTVGYCFKMTCPSNSKILIHVGNQTRQCLSSGELVTFSGYHGSIICPDPAVVCGSLRYLAPDSPAEGEADTQWHILLAVLLASIVFIADVAGVVACVRRAKRNGDHMADIETMQSLPSGESAMIAMYTVR